jgi:spermidine/putrescine transport system ATP-binding protein
VAVELRAVVIRYQGVVALNGIDLRIHDGEFFSLLGPSGCGKTTTLNIIGGFIEPDEGEVLIQGRSVRGNPPHRRPVNTVFQSYALFPHMTIAENVGFGPRMARTSAAETARRVRDALALVSLEGFENRRPSQLSGGQQQRVALARALINRPAVLLLDEPLGALDLKLRKQMQSELSRIQREVGITFVYVTHDQEEAMTMSDRIAVVDKGTIVQIGTPQEIYERPSSLFVADFIGSSNILSGRVVERGDAAAIVYLDAGVSIRVPATHASAPGDRVHVVLRPDHLKFGGIAAAGANRISGRVIKVSYLGTHLQVAVSIGPGHELTVAQALLPEGAGGKPVEPGAQVEVSWPIARARCFAAEQTASEGMRHGSRPNRTHGQEL